MDDDKYPNKSFFWAIVFYADKEWACDYCDTVVRNRNKLNVDNFEKTKINITKEWLNKLLMYEYKSKGMYITIKLLLTFPFQIYSQARSQ